MTVPALEITGLCKNFGALAVTRNIDLTLGVGARHALIGPNGAGKTTLLNQITGLLRPTAGRIALFGQDVTAASPETRVRRGLVRTFQINSLFNGLSVAENLGLADAAVRRRDGRLWGRHAGRSGLSDPIAELLERLDLLPLAAARIDSLAYGQRRLVEIALALALRPKVLLLDEPAAGIASGESARLFEILMKLPADIAVLVIEHDMQLVFRFAETLTVLVDGGVLVEGPVETVRADQRVRDVYLGRRHHD